MHPHLSRENIDFTTGYHFREQGPSGRNHVSISTQDVVQPNMESGRVIVCKNCLNPVTSGRERIEKEGAHVHIFSNPYGNVFEIGCFRQANGCVYLGKATNEFTWFKGYAWKLALCRSCAAHLGWVYLSPDAVFFYGLILDRLMETESDQTPGLGN